MNYARKMKSCFVGIPPSQELKPVRPILLFRFTGTVQQLRDYIAWCQRIKRELSKQPVEKL